MKKYGKYEKRPNEAAAKQPKEKSPLLQTYFTSLMCLVLCVTMFFGTTFAWFTSEVNNAQNEIYIGILDVELEKQVPDGNYVSLSKADADGNMATLFDGNTRWEPGYTALETIRVVNEGDLAFRYVLSFTDGKATKAQATEETDTLETEATDTPETETTDEQETEAADTPEAEVTLADVAQYFEVWVYDYYENKNAEPQATSYTEISEGKGWKYVGTLAEILAGKAVLSGSMDAVRDATPASEDSSEATEANNKKYTIALHMSESADASVMGCKISLNVKLVADQMGSETDGFENGAYDDLAGVVNLAELKESLANTGDVLLTSNIEIKDLADILTMANNIVLDGNGKTITYSGTRPENGASVGVLTTAGGTIWNLTIDGGEDGRALYITSLTSDLYVSGCTFGGAYAFNLNSADKTEYTLNFNNTTFQSWTSYANVMEHAYFVGCTFENTLRPYGDTTLTDCQFGAEGKLDVSSLEAGETITLVNCTYGGVLIEKAVLTAVSDAEGKIVVTCDNALLEIQNGVVSLADAEQN